MSNNFINSCIFDVGEIWYYRIMVQVVLTRNVNYCRCTWMEPPPCLLKKGRLASANFTVGFLLVTLPRSSLSSLLHVYMLFAFWRYCCVYLLNFYWVSAEISEYTLNLVRLCWCARAVFQGTYTPLYSNCRLGWLGWKTLSKRPNAKSGIKNATRNVVTCQSLI